MEDFHSPEATAILKLSGNQNVSIALHTVSYQNCTVSPHELFPDTAELIAAW